jgi:uncharacterized protein
VAGDVKPIRETVAVDEAEWVADGGWSSAVTGLGDPNRDRARTLRSLHTGPLPDEELESMFHDDDVAARACEARPEEMLRRGFRLQVQSAPEDGPDGMAAAFETATAAQTWCDEMRVVEHLTDAMVWANVFGGAAVFLGAVDGRRLEEPLDEERVRTVSFLTVLDRRYLAVERYQEDPLAPGFGEPELYRFVPREGVASLPAGDLLVHASRLLCFHGARTSRTLRRQNFGWGYSLLQRMHRIHQLFAGAWLSVGHRLTDWSMAVWGMQGLSAILSGPNKKELAARLTVMERYRSTVRAALIEKDKESFEFQTASFEGVVDLLNSFSERISAAARVPRTILFGTSPAGLNATGASDVRAFYDSVAREREAWLKPRLERLIKVMFLAADGPTGGVEPETWDVEFPPLWEPEPKEEAEIRKLSAETDQILVNIGEVAPEEAARSHFRPEGWSPEIQIDLSLRDKPELVPAASAATPPPQDVSAEQKPTEQKPTEQKPTGGY